MRKKLILHFHLQNKIKLHLCRLRFFYFFPTRETETFFYKLGILLAQGEKEKDDNEKQLRSDTPNLSRLLPIIYSNRYDASLLNKCYITHHGAGLPQPQGPQCEGHRAMAPSLC